MNPLLYVDYYKTEHHRMYPENTTMIYSNFTPRKSRIEGIDKVVVFGIQHFIKEYLIKRFNNDFFGTEDYDFYKVNDGSRNKYLKEDIIKEYKKHIPVDTKHIEALWDLGYLPLEIKALPEGTLCPIGVPLLTIRNTHPDFFWLTNYVETLLSCTLWQPITSATIAHEYKKLLTKYCLETDEKNIEFINWQGHDFSMRGMSSVESAILSGMGHLLSFTGTDTIPAIYQLEESYNATGLIGASVPATEHSVMCMGTKDDEIGTLSRLMKLYPTGILSVVSDTWDLWKLIIEYLPKLKNQILARDGKLVVRPDSGDPVDIICGTCKERPDITHLSTTGKERIKNWCECKGVIELLWDIFGGTVNEQGYKVLDSHIGAIYGDSITIDRAKQICERLKQKGFASTNIVLGIGSYTYQYNTRDTFGFAMKATYGELTSYIDIDGNDKVVETREIFKAPVTDSGEKKSAKGLLRVCKLRDYDGTSELGKFDSSDMNQLILVQKQNWEEEKTGELQTVFKDGKLIKETNLEEIRNRLNGK